MKNKFKQKKGQAVMMEYVIGVLLAVAAVVAMTTYVQRGVQARIRDTRNAMIKEVALSANPRSSNKTFPVMIEYEPYYGNVASDVDSNTTKFEHFVDSGKDRAYVREFRYDTNTISTSQQFAPKDKGLTE